MRIASIILLFIFTHTLHAQHNNYKAYHLNINKAEEQAFVNNDIKGALKTYLSTFKLYDFVFVHDCMVAIQLALYEGNCAALLAITDKATKNGLMPRHMVLIPYIKKHDLYTRYKDSIAAQYSRNRSHYLRRIDTNTLQQMYSLYAYDQMEKNPIKNETFSGRETGRRYTRQVEETMAKLKVLIKQKGWPSDQLTGIEQVDIMKELKTGSPDLLHLFKLIKERENYPASITTSIEEYRFHSNLFFPIMAHYGTYFNFDFFNDRFYIWQIEAGLLHPKDLAHLLDFRINANNDNTTSATMQLTQRYFGTGIAGRCKEATIADYKAPLEKINKTREQFYIKPIEIELAKDKFMRIHKMYFAFGWDGCRL